jgi:hypothetical protein
VLTLFLLSTVDGLLTITSIGLGLAHEANPVMALLYHAHPLVFFCGKQALMYGCCLMLLKGATKRPSAVMGATIGACVVYTLVFAWHMVILGVSR